MCGLSSPSSAQALGKEAFSHAYSSQGMPSPTPYRYPEKPVIHLMEGGGGRIAPYLACDQEGTGQGTLLVLCDPGAVLPLPRASVSTLRKKGVVGKETMRPIKTSLIALLWVGIFQIFTSHSPRQPPPQGHTLPRVCCQEA